MDCDDREQKAKQVPWCGLHWETDHLVHDGFGVSRYRGRANMDAEGYRQNVPLGNLPLPATEACSPELHFSYSRVDNLTRRCRARRSNSKRSNDRWMTIGEPESPKLVPEKPDGVQGQ
jgi:hypothetical protein